MIRCQLIIFSRLNGGISNHPSEFLDVNDGGAEPAAVQLSSEMIDPGD